MNLARPCILAPALAAILGTAPAAHAYEFRTQWVYRVGAGQAFDVVPASGFNAQSLGIAPGTAVRFQLQFGVFDDAASDAPAGGFLGWHMGTMTATGGMNTRTPGRLSPFDFAPNPPGNGLPSADPWMVLTQIDNRIGTQLVTGWLGIDGTSDPGPPPPAVIRGGNEFVSTYEITSTLGATDYLISGAGTAVAGLPWNVVVREPPLPGGDGVFGPPGSPEDEDDIVGRILYSAFPDSPGQPFSTTLSISIPGPSAAALLVFAGLMAVCRRRHCGVLDARE